MVRTRAAWGTLSPAEYAAPLLELSPAFRVARDGYIAYLKSSGERLGDLVTMSDEELAKWYGIVKQQHERQRKALEERSKR